MANELAVVKMQFPASQMKVSPEEFKRHMQGLTMSLDRILFPSGKSTSYELPDGNGGTNPQKTFQGVIIDHYPAKAWWAEKYSGGSVPPSCSSRDLIHGEGPNCPSASGKCADCPMNQFGTALNQDGSRGRGKACKEMHLVFPLINGEPLPFQLTITPTSLKNFGEYLGKRILMAGYEPHEIMTEFALEPAKSGDGIDYMKATFKRVGVLSPDDFAKISGLIEGFQSATRRAVILSEDYDVGDRPSSAIVDDTSSTVPNVNDLDLDTPSPM